jgi:activator of 2-hydroxyglutaryl-CoA dehydratase
MNDRCSAGTGRFLEIMCKALGYKIKVLFMLKRIPVKEDLVSAGGVPFFGSYRSRYFGSTIL